MAAPSVGRTWGPPLVGLALILGGPLALWRTPLHTLAFTWLVLLFLALWGFLVAALVGAMLQASMPPLAMLERLVRRWVAWCSSEPEHLWLQWARQAHNPALGRLYLDRAVRLGGREAQFQEALVYLESGLGAGGQTAAIDRFRRAARRGHPEAAFRLAEALRQGLGSVLPDPGEAQAWYQRAAALGFGPAAAWLAHAYGAGDGVAADPGLAERWAAEAGRLAPHPPCSHSLLRHDSAPDDPLVRASSAAVRRLEAAADRAVARRSGRWGLLMIAVLLGGAGLLWAGFLFWTGSAALFHLPLLMLAPPLVLLALQAWGLRRDRPKVGRDRLLEAAEAGDPEACHRLGLAYRRGGPARPRDDLSAALWFRKAADMGHREAMLALSEAYLGGHGVLRDPREAARWAEAARRESTS